MIAVYDSGLGGLTVLGALRRAGVTQDAIYFADQAHVPYGDRTDAEIQTYHRENFALLADAGVALLVMGCNSSCAVGGRLGWPSTRFPILDLIATAGASFAGTPYRRIAVVATPTTVRSGAYARAIRGAAPQASVVEVAAPALVPLVESGLATSARAHEAVAAVVAEFPPDIDAMVYGCTHYPLLDRAFGDALPAGVARVDPAQAQAAAATVRIAALGLAPGSSATTYWTNGDETAFARGVRLLTGEANPRVTRPECHPELVEG